nr:pseudouridine synthase [Sphingomonas changnyeongensis]
MIAEGRIAIDGVTVTTPATILTSLHGVTVDGQPVRAPAPARLFLFHKPRGLLTAARDPAGRPTIYDRLPDDLPRVMPVGRLDLNTEGLLLLTTDGELKRALELPSTGVPRTYRARAYGQISQADLEALIEGVEIDGMRYGAIDANLERRTGANVWIELTLTEGKNREVRRVLEHLGLEVSRLIRTRYGPFVLDDLAEGAVAEVRQHDLVVFRRTLKPGKGAFEPADPRPAPPPPARRGPERTGAGRPRPVGRDAAPKAGAGAVGRTLRPKPVRPDERPADSVRQPGSAPGARPRLRAENEGGDGRQARAPRGRADRHGGTDETAKGAHGRARPDRAAPDTRPPRRAAPDGRPPRRAREPDGGTGRDFGTKPERGPRPERRQDQAGRPPRAGKGRAPGSGPGDADRPARGGGPHSPAPTGPGRPPRPTRPGGRPRRG